jgi:glycosyltransferase involved in cell wall biosynthesis
MRSVVEQDYPRLEYHVADGGSADGSADIIQRYASRLAGWRSEQDSGPCAAINHGFAQSTGEIMAWLNSDDLLMPGAVKFVAAYFALHPDVDVVYGHRVVVDERDWEVGRWVLPPHDGEVQLWTDFIPQETMFWRRSAWDKVGARLDESFHFAFDWDLILRFQKAGLRMKRLPWFLGCFRTHDSQKSAVQLSTVGAEECARLRQRELGAAYNDHQMNRQMVLFQKKAIRYTRLMRWGLRW